MQDERIPTIINEIRFWRENKLLPEVYCDFLLALYTNGEAEIEPPARNRSKLLFKIQHILLVLLLPFSFLVLYFTQFSFFLQLSLLFLFMLYSLWMYFYVREPWNKTVDLGLMNSLLLFLLISISLSKEYLNSITFSFIILFIQFSGWYVIGKKQQLTYLRTISILALLFLFIYIAFTTIL